MKDIGKKKVKINLHYQGSKTQMMVDEEFAQAGLGELVNLYIGLKMMPWWKRLYKTSLLREFALEDLETILNQWQVTFEKRLTKYL